MSREKISRIYDAHPLCFRMAVMIECDDGWLDLIEKTLDKLEDLISKLTPQAQEVCYITQIKEKHGFLHIYMNTSSDEMHELLDEAEDKSLEICEVCGNEGEFIKEPYYKRVRCNEHTNY